MATKKHWNNLAWTKRLTRFPNHKAHWLVVYRLATMGSSTLRWQLESCSYIFLKSSSSWLYSTYKQLQHNMRLMHKISWKLCSAVTSSREEWATEDTATIEQALQPYEECPWNSEINKLFNSTPELHLILDSNSFERIRNKVKNLMRKKTKRPKH